MEILGIVVSLLGLMYFAYRGINVLVLAPVMALLACSFHADAPLLASYTQVFMPALGGYLLQYFPVFLLGSIFGKLMSDSGAAAVIGRFVASKLGAERGVLAVIVACAVLTYGGVSLFVVAFSVYPIAVELFRAGQIPKRLIPASIALGSFTFTMSGLPGTPAIQNAIPMPFFGTTAFAAPGLGMIGAIVMFGAGYLWLDGRARRMQCRGEGYGEPLDGAGTAAGTGEARGAPSAAAFAKAVTPLAMVLVINLVLSRWVLPAMDHGYFFETVASGFDRPVALKFDSQHRLHVLDSGTGELFRVDIANGEKELVGRTGAGSDNLAFDADDRLFVSSHTHGFIVEVLGPETNRTVVAGGVSFPGGLAWLPAAEGGGRLFLADRRALRELDPETGAEVHVVPGVGSDVGEALSAHPHGAQLLLSGATSVSIWDPDADRLVARFEGFEQAVDALPLGGDIIVSEYETGSVLRFNPASPDERTVLASGLEAPAGLAVHGGDLYVADRSGTLLQILDDGERMEPPRLVAGGLAGPEGIAADDDGTLYVVEEDAGRVTQVDPETGAATLVADGLTLQSLEQKSIEGATSVGFLSGIAVGDGSLYLSSYAENRVYRIDR